MTKAKCVCLYATPRPNEKRWRPEIGYTSSPISKRFFMFFFEKNDPEDLYLLKNAVQRIPHIFPTTWILNLNWHYITYKMLIVHCSFWNWPRLKKLPCSVDFPHTSLIALFSLIFFQYQRLNLLIMIHDL